MDGSQLHFPRDEDRPVMDLGSSVFDLAGRLASRRVFGQLRGADRKPHDIVGFWIQDEFTLERNEAPALVRLISVTASLERYVVRILQETPAFRQFFPFEADDASIQSGVQERSKITAA